MTTYVSSIGNDNADYATVNSWYSAQRQRTDLQDGDVIVGALQNGVTDGHTGNHVGGFGSGGSTWTSQKDITVIVSGTYPDRTATFGTNPLFDIDGFTYINAENHHLTFKLEDLDVSSDSRLRFQSDDVIDSSGIEVHFNNLRILQENSGFFEDFTGDIRALSAVSAAATDEEKLALIPRSDFYWNNCTWATTNEAGDLWRHHPTTYDHFRSKIDIVGCTFRMTGNSGELFDPEFPGAGKVVEYQFNISASLYDTSGGTNITLFHDAGDFYYYGNVVDYISNESTSDFEGWTSSTLVTNYTQASGFQYGSAPGTNEVAFSADGTGYTYPDFRLYDDSNNIAIDYVTNVTPPSPDLAGNDRGTSPFDAGAFSLISGGEDSPPDAGGVALPLTFAYRININD